MSDDPYVYPGTNVLRNKLNITSAAALDRAERNLVTQRMRETIPAGDFDLAHLQAIHRHLFQDVYEWAGQVRTVEISKGGDKFQLRRFIESGMGNIHDRLVKANYLRDLSPKAFADAAGPIIGDVNYVHPFREGNGRTQLHYLKQLVAQAGHELDLAKLRGEAWIDASREAHQSRYESMSRAIEEAMAHGEKDTQIPSAKRSAGHARQARSRLTGQGQRTGTRTRDQEKKDDDHEI